jgi:short-subunit dehydrogenase
MKSLNGQNAILTGASGGIGSLIARSLAAQGVNVFLVAFPGDGLAALSETISQRGSKAAWRVLDLRNEVDRDETVRCGVAELGRVDILVNNAGVEFNGRFHDLTREQIRDVLSVNLEAPMMLTHALLPQMLKQKHGHIVNISSLAGKSGPAYQEPYAATKGALTPFTLSLRATYRRTGVSASVICPGFVEAGIYTRLKERTGCAAPALLGACPPERVASAVLRAIRHDLPEIIINRYPVRPLLALSALFPRVGEWVISRLGADEFFSKAIVSPSEQPTSDPAALRNPGGQSSPSDTQKA